MLRQTVLARAALTAMLTAFVCEPLMAAVRGAAPAVVSDAIACRTVPDSQARLACYDHSIAALADSYASGQLLVADKEQVAKARRSLFGLSLPSFDLLGSKTSEPALITDMVATSGFDASGAVSFSLQSGSTWLQIDTSSLPTAPKPGTSITIRKNMIGSYFASFQRYSFKVHRLN